MKTAAALLSILTAFALVGTIDYQVAAGLAAEHGPQTIATAPGELHVR